MRKIIRNINGKATAELEIYNKLYVVGPKKTLTIDHIGQQKHPAYILLDKYQFLVDITPKKVFPVQDNPRVALGKKS